MTLPGPEATHRWQGRTLVDHHGEPLGTIEVIYLDKVTNQPEWALLEAGAGLARTFVPLVSAGEEGDTVRVPFAKTLVEGAPSMPADRELSEDQEGELYRHYGVPYSQADSPSGLPAATPSPPNRPWRLAKPSRRRSRCPPAPPRWLPESPRCLLRSQPRPPKPCCRPTAVPRPRLRCQNRRRSPPPLLGQHPGVSMSQSPRQLRPTITW
jgi:hypothetical protein